MADMPRESRFIPTVKCSTCGQQVEISLMGEHVCGAVEESAPEPEPPVPAVPSLFSKLNPFGGGPSPEKQTRIPPRVDTSAANRTYDNGRGQGTSVSLSTGQISLSPKTPNGRSAFGGEDEQSGTQGRDDSSPPQQGRRPGGYGSFADSDASGDSTHPSSSPKRHASNLLQRMNTIAPGPFNAGLRPLGSSSTFPLGSSPDDSGALGDERPGTSASNVSFGGGGGKAPKAPRKNGYGGFGPPRKAQGEFEPEPLNRSETFPRHNEAADGPMRTPSAPGPRPGRRRDSSSDSSPDFNPKPLLFTDRSRKSSRGGPDTPRLMPPPQISFLSRPGGDRDGKGAAPAINLADEFGASNPYHTPSESTSSSASGQSNSGTSTQPSSAGSPTESSDLHPMARKASDTSSFDGPASDHQSSTDLLKPKDASSAPGPLHSPLKSKFPYSPLRGRPLPSDRGYDPRIDPALRSRSDRIRSPLAPPAILDPLARVDPAIQEPLRDLVPMTPLTPTMPVTPMLPTTPMTPMPTSLPVPRSPAPPSTPNAPAAAAPVAPSPREPSPREPSPREPSPKAPLRDPSPVAPSPKEVSPIEKHEDAHSPSQPNEPTRAQSQKTAREPAAHSSRGDCKACGEPIKGKSISSADGRLTGRYHKACFVCMTCKEPFTSATFYVLEDRPYCERHYHQLNGSLCGSCGNGIEGQYLEDASSRKHHVGCFRCGDCGMALRDGYFEVAGRAFCERDAWRRMQQQQQQRPPWQQAGGFPGGPHPGPGPGPGPWMNNGRKGSLGGPGMSPLGRGGLPPGPRGGPGLNIPNPSRFGPPKPRMEKRMTRLGMM